MHMIGTTAMQTGKSRPTFYILKQDVVKF